MFRAIAAVMLFVLSGLPAMAQSRYDGTWLVKVVTTSGPCDEALQSSVQVQNGLMMKTGKAGVDISGRVNEHGVVQVNLTKGGQGGDGAGKLTGNRGAGRWTASAALIQCTGTWSAQRRL